MAQLIKIRIFATCFQALNISIGIRVMELFQQAPLPTVIERRQVIRHADSVNEFFLQMFFVSFGGFGHKPNKDQSYRSK